MHFKLVCTVPFHDRESNHHFEKGHVVCDQDEVARHTEMREKHFVRVLMTADEVALHVKAAD